MPVLLLVPQLQAWGSVSGSWRSKEILSEVASLWKGAQMMSIQETQFLSPPSRLWESLVTFSCYLWLPLPSIKVFNVRVSSTGYQLLLNPWHRIQTFRKGPSYTNHPKTKIWMDCCNQKCLKFVPGSEYCSVACKTVQYLLSRWQAEETCFKRYSEILIHGHWPLGARCSNLFTVPNITNTLRNCRH